MQFILLFQTLIGSGSAQAPPHTVGAQIMPPARRGTACHVARNSVPQTETEMVLVLKFWYIAFLKPVVNHVLCLPGSYTYCVNTNQCGPDRMKARSAIGCTVTGREASVKAIRVVTGYWLAAVSLGLQVGVQVTINRTQHRHAHVAQPADNCNHVTDKHGASYRAALS